MPPTHPQGNTGPETTPGRWAGGQVGRWAPRVGLPELGALTQATPAAHSPLRVIRVRLRCCRPRTLMWAALVQPARGRNAAVAGVEVAVADGRDCCCVWQRSQVHWLCASRGPRGSPPSPSEMCAHSPYPTVHLAQVGRDARETTVSLSTVRAALALWGILEEPDVLSGVTLTLTKHKKH